MSSVPVSSSPAATPKAPWRESSSASATSGTSVRASSTGTVPAMRTVGTGYVTLTSCRTLTPAQLESVGELVRKRLRAQQVTSSGITL